MVCLALETNGSGKNGAEASNGKGENRCQEAGLIEYAWISRWLLKLQNPR